MLPFVLSLAALLGQKPQTDSDRLVALQVSKECRDSGDKFWQRGGFKSTEQATWDYLTHYNRHEGKCFIRVTVMDRNPKPESTVVMTVFDAVDGFLIGTSMAAWDGKEWVNRSVTDVSNNSTPTVDSVAWFDGLMSQ
jgi:hypothetical protein